MHPTLHFFHQSIVSVVAVIIFLTTSVSASTSTTDVNFEVATALASNFFQIMQLE